MKKKSGGKTWNLIKWDIYYVIKQNKKAYMPDEIFICQPKWCTILSVQVTEAIVRITFPSVLQEQISQKSLFFLPRDLSLFYIYTMLQNWHKDFLAKAGVVPTYYQKNFFSFIDCQFDKQDCSRLVRKELRKALGASTRWNATL